jgi:hypothetical protein
MPQLLTLFDVGASGADTCRHRPDVRPAQPFRCTTGRRVHRVAAFVLAA